MGARVAATTAAPTAVVVTVYLAFSAAYLLDYPPIYADEPWDLSPAISLLRTGHLALPIFGEHYANDPYYYGYVAAWLRVAGVSMTSARLLSVLHGAAILVVVHLLGRRLGGGRLAWLGPLFLLLTFPFLGVSHYVRPDVIMLFYAVLGLVLYLRAEATRSPWTAFAGGASVAFAVCVFPLGIWALVALLVIAAIDLRGVRCVGGAAFGGAAAAILPYGIYALLTWHDFVRFNRKFSGSTILSGRNRERGLPETLLHEIRHEPQRYRFLLDAAGSHLYAAAVVVTTALVLVAVARSRDPRRLVLLLAAPLTLAISADNKTSAYLLSVVAVASAFIPSAFAGMRRPLVPLLPLVLAGALAVPYARVVHRTVAPISTSWAAVARAYRVAYRFPPRSLVIGLPNDYAYWMNDRNVEFRTLHELTSFDDFALLDAASASRKLQRLARTHRVFLVYSPAFFATLGQFEPDRAHPRLPGLERLVHRRCRVVATVDVHGSAYGDFSDTIARFVPTGRG